MDNHGEERLKQIEMRLIRRFEHISAVFGIMGLKARLLSILLTSINEPRSLTELTNLSQFSKAQVSRAMRELVLEMPMIEVFKKPQDRERYYVIRFDIIDFITGFISRTVYEEAEPTIQATQEAARELKQLIRSTDNADFRERAKKFLERVQEINRQYRKYYWIATQLLTYMNNLSDQWNKEHANEQ